MAAGRCLRLVARRIARVADVFYNPERPWRMGPPVPVTALIGVSIGLVAAASVYGVLSWLWAIVAAVLGAAAVVGL